MAPLKKKNALLSSGEPANSSMLNGPAGASATVLPSRSVRPRPSAGRSGLLLTPTLKLSNVA